MVSGCSCPQTLAWCSASPARCRTADWLPVPQDNKCGAAGCTACQQGGAKLLVAGAASSTDAAVCITELCDDLSDTGTGTIYPNRAVHKPVNLNLWRCARLGRRVGTGWVSAAVPGNGTAPCCPGCNLMAKASTWFCSILLSMLGQSAQPCRPAHPCLQLCAALLRDNHSAVLRQRAGLHRMVGWHVLARSLQALECPATPLCLPAQGLRAAPRVHLSAS